MGLLEAWQAVAEKRSLMSDFAAPKTRATASPSVTCRRPRAPPPRPGNEIRAYAKAASRSSKAGSGAQAAGMYIAITSDGTGCTTSSSSVVDNSIDEALAVLRRHRGHHPQRTTASASSQRPRHPTG